MVRTQITGNLLANLSAMAGLGSLLLAAQPLIAQSSALSYQGFLTDAGRPANAIYDLRFTLFDAATDGWVAADPVDIGDLTVTNGLFNVMLDFGGTAFDGSDRWLQIAVRPGESTGDFTNVVPRQKITATPYAIRAANFSGPVDASQITGTIAPSHLGDGMITSDKFAAGAVVANLTAGNQGTLVFDGGGVTNLDAGNLNSGTIPDARFPAVLPAIDGSQLTGINGGGVTNLDAGNLGSGTIPAARFPAVLPAIDGSQLTGISGINPLFGQATNTDLLNPSYRGILNSTNAYSVVRAAITDPPDSAQVWQQIYTGDREAAPFSFVATAVTNGFNPAVNDPSPFSGLSDVQLHYGYNMGNAPGYKSSLPTWVRGVESTWFNPWRPATLEVYDRYALPNGIVGNVGFGYDLHLETGRIEATIDSHSLDIRNPTTGLGWMNFACTTNGEGVINLGYNGSGYISTLATNEWIITSGGRGVIGIESNKNYLFSNGGSDDSVTFFKGGNSVGNEYRLTVGTTNPRSLRWNGTNGNRWEYEVSAGVFRAFNDEVSPMQKSYSIPMNTYIGENNGDYRTIGSLTNTVTDVQKAVIVQFDILQYAAGVSRTLFACNYGNAHSDWQELLPISSSWRYDAARCAVDVRYVASQFEFRYRRVGTNDVDNGPGSFQGVVTVYSTLASDAMRWIGDVTGSGSGATVGKIEASTPLVQSTGKVGINTNNPQAELHVAGNSIVTGTASAAGGFLIKSNSWLAIPTLEEGDVWLGSSNGILYSISLIEGTYTTNRLVP